MNAIRIPSLLLLVACITSAQQGDTSGVSDGLDRRRIIDKYVDEHMETAGCPGVSVAAFENGELVFSKSYGVSNEDGSPVTTETVFSVASITKPVLAMAVLQIEAKGLLKIDDRVAIHIPGFESAVPGLAKKLTIRHLLTHHSGITTKSGRLGQREKDPLVNDRQQLLNLVALARITAGPGEVFQYSNVNYWLLGRIINEVTGENYSTYIDRELFGKLGLRHTQMNKPLGEDVAEPHLIWFGSANPQALQPFNSGPASGLYTTPSDYVRLLIEFQNENPAVFPQGIVKNMATHPSGDQGGADEYWQGLGWGVFQHDTGRCFIHSGLNIGYEGFVYLDPNNDSGIAVFANAGSGFASNDVTGLLRGIVRIWNRDRPRPLNGFGFQKLILWAAIFLNAMIVIWAVWFAYRFASWRLPIKTGTSRWIGIIAPSAFLLTFGYVAYYLVPDLFDANMRVARAYNPDAAFVMTALAAVCYAFGIIRLLSLVAFPGRSLQGASGNDTE